MDKNLLRVIDLMTQLRYAIKECKDLISCDLRGEFYGTDTGHVDGIKAEIQMSGSCGIGFADIKPFSQEYNEHYTIVNGVKVFCLMDKEEEK